MIVPSGYVDPREGSRFALKVLATGPSASDAMPGVVCPNARVVLNALIVLDQLGRDAIGQVGRHIIKDSGLKVPDPHEDLEIRNC